MKFERNLERRVDGHRAGAAFGGVHRLVGEGLLAEVPGYSCVLPF